MDHLNVYPWSFSSGLESSWKGGPSADADGERTGGFALMDMSVLYDNPRENFQSRGWVITELMSQTNALGNCVQFYYVLAGLNVQSLRLIRVDIDTHQFNEETNISNKTMNIPSVPTKTVADTQEVYSKSIEASLNFNNGMVEVNQLNIKFQALKLFSRPTLCGNPRRCPMMKSGGKDNTVIQQLRSISSSLRLCQARRMM